MPDGRVAPVHMLLLKTMCHHLTEENTDIHSLRPIIALMNNTRVEHMRLVLISEECSDLSQKKILNTEKQPDFFFTSKINISIIFKVVCV